MNPIGHGSPVDFSFNHPVQTSGTIIPAPGGDPAIQKNAADAYDQAARLLNLGMNARLIKDKLTHFEDARKLNRTALDALGTNELSAKAYDKQREESHRQGADIAACLFDIRHKQLQFDPREDARKMRLEAALGEAETMLAHLRNAGPSSDIKNRIGKAAADVMEFAGGLGDAHRADSENAEGKEKIALLSCAKKYYDAAYQAIQEAGLESSFPEKCKLMRGRSLMCSARASDAAVEWMNAEWLKYDLNDHAGNASSDDADADYKLGVACMEQNDYCSQIHQEMFDSSVDFIKEAAKYRHSTGEIENAESLKADAHRRLINVALDRAAHAMIILDTRVERCMKSEDDALEALHVAVQEMSETDELVFGTLGKLRRFETGDPTQVAQIKEILPSAIAFCDDRSERINWLATVCQNADVANETLHHELKRTSDSALALKRVLENEYETILAGEKPDPERSRANQRFGLPMQSPGSEKVRKKGKGKDIGKQSGAAPAAGGGPEECVIETRFNGKLIGIPRDGKVTVERASGKKVDFRRDGEKWVKDEEASQDIEDRQAEEVGLQAQREPLERARLKIGALVEDTQAEVDGLKNEASKYCRLSDYSARQDAPFSQSIGIFNLAMSAYQRAIVLLDKGLKKIEHSAVPGAERDGYRAPLQTLRTEMENLRRTAKEAKLTSIKRHPSGPALEYLMDENEVAAIRKTANREELTGPNIPLNKQDFLDKYRPAIKGYGDWPEIHTHYRSRNARLDSATACHMVVETDGEKARLPVSRALLARLEQISI